MKVLVFLKSLAGICRDSRFHGNDGLYKNNELHGINEWHKIDRFREIELCQRSAEKDGVNDKVANPNSIYPSFLLYCFNLRLPVYRQHLQKSEKQAEFSNKSSITKILGLALFLFAFLGATCTNKSQPESRFEHSFKTGTADNLYNIHELLGENYILNSEEVFFAESTNSKGIKAGEQAKTVNKEQTNIANNDQTKTTNKEQANNDQTRTTNNATINKGQDPNNKQTTTTQNPSHTQNPDNLQKYPALSSNGGYPKEILNPDNISQLLQIKTASRGEPAMVSFAQQNIVIDPSISFINKYQILDYTIANAKVNSWNQYIAKLIGQVDRFKGFPNSTYYILPVFEGNHLVLYKLGPEDKIPYDELPLAKRVGNLLAVPFIGYPIRYCVPEVVPDINYRETGQFIPYCEGVSKQFAQYIELFEHNKKVFHYEKKPDFFPKDFFTLNDNSNWFYVRTVVTGPNDSYVGHQPFLPAHLVEFVPTSENLQIRDASGYNIKEDDQVPTLFIPVQWVDFQVKKDSEFLHRSFKEEIKEDTQYQNRQYMKIQFDRLVENEFPYVGAPSLKSVFITDNYFSFNIEITNKGSPAYLIKYAFYKKPNKTSYVAKQWFEEDSTEFFPTFAEERKYYKNAIDFHNTAQHDQFLRVTRFDPQDREIKWYFSTQTPKKEEDLWVRELGILAIDLINKAFEIAGSDCPLEKLIDSPPACKKPFQPKLKIVLEPTPDKDKELGDIRYNILNLMLTEGKSGSGLIGFGPNIANPITGEVVSATANVWLSTVLEIYTNIVKKYIRFEVYKPSWALQPFSNEITSFLTQKLYSEDPQCKDSAFQTLGVTPFLHEKIQSICPDVIAFINKEKQKPHEERFKYLDDAPQLLDDKALLESCSKKLAFIPLLGVTLHEILHGFGARHVFSASVDSQNFYQSHAEIEKFFGKQVSDTIKELLGDFPYVDGEKCHPTPPKYSSVMDYMNFYNPMLYVPGKLDIATLRFMYFDKVDLKNGEILEVPAGANQDPKNPQKSIQQTAQEKPLKEYNVLCGGEKVDEKYQSETNPDKPLCKKFDYGTKPLEIAVNYILQFHNHSLTNGRNRYDSFRIPSWSLDRIFKSTINHGIGELYQKWMKKRDDFLASNEKRIENYSFLKEEDRKTYKNEIQNQYEKIINTLDPEQDHEFASYYEIRETFFNYIKRLSFMPSKHCIYKKGEKYQAISFKKIIDSAKANHNKYPKGSREKAIHCQSPVVQAGTAGAGDFITEVGFFGQNIEYFFRANPLDKPDELSVFNIWPDIFGPLVKKPKDDLFFKPAFSDDYFRLFLPLDHLITEPDFAYEYYQEMLAYILEGTYLNSYIHPDFIDPSLIRSYPNLISNLKNPEYLKPVLNYKEDKDNSLALGEWNVIDYRKGVFRYRLDKLDQIFSGLQNNQERTEHYFWDVRHLKDITLTRESINNDNPFFEQVYHEWIDCLLDKEQSQVICKNFTRDKQNSLELFIKNHPESLYDSFQHNWIATPYSKQDPNNKTKTNLWSLVFQRVNQFKGCLEQEQNLGIPCENSADKKAYIDSILRHIYQENMQSETAMRVVPEDSDDF